MVVPLGQQYNIGEKLTVILHSYINRHAGTPEKQQRRNSYLKKNQNAPRPSEHPPVRGKKLCDISNNKDESNTIIATRTEDHDDVKSSYQVHDPAIHLEVDEEQ